MSSVQPVIKIKTPLRLIAQGEEEFAVPPDFAECAVRISSCAGDNSASFFGNDALWRTGRPLPADNSGEADFMTFYHLAATGGSL